MKREEHKTGSQYYVYRNRMEPTNKKKKRKTNLHFRYTLTQV